MKSYPSYSRVILNESRIAASSSITRMRDLAMALEGFSALAFHYKFTKRFLIQRFDADLSCLFELAPSVGARHEIRRLLADRTGDARTQLLERRRGLLARHRRERAGQDEDLTRERSRL